MISHHNRRPDGFDIFLVVEDVIFRVRSFPMATSLVHDIPTHVSIGTQFGDLAWEIGVSTAYDNPIGSHQLHCIRCYFNVNLGVVPC